VGSPEHSILPGVTLTVNGVSDIQLAIEYMTKKRDELLSDLNDELKENVYYEHVVDSIKEELNEILTVNSQLRLLNSLLVVIQKYKNKENG
jgi:hypothetical protein